MKIQKKNGGLGGEGSGWGSQGGCDRRIEVFGKIHQKKFRGRGGGGVRVGGVRVDVNEELEVFVKIQKKIGVGGGGSGWGGGVRVDVN